MYSSLFYLMGLGLFFGNYDCMRMLKLIPGAPAIVYYDKHYLENVVATTRRNSRKSDYVVNLEFTTLVTFGNNLSVTVILYEYLHNEYRRSFIELHSNLCNMINKDPLVGGIVRKAGITTCPLPPGKYSLTNMTFDQEFPNAFPFEKGKGELIAKLPKNQVIARGDLVLTFKQREV